MANNASKRCHCLFIALSFLDYTHAHAHTHNYYPTIYMYVVLVKSLWAASIDGHVGYSGSLP